MLVACRDVKSLVALVPRTGRLACAQPRIDKRKISQTSVAWRADPRTSTQCCATTRMATHGYARTIINPRFMRRSSRATPRAAPIPAQLSFGNAKWEDGFQWLQDPENPATKKYITKENEYTSEMMASTVPFQKELYQEMKARVYDTEDTVPEKHGDYWYYTRMGERDNFSIYCRRQGSMDNPYEEVMVDQNIEGKNQRYIHINVLKLSNNHEMLAYTMDSEGMEEYALKIKHISSNTILEDTIFPVVSIEWGDDNTVYYTKPDEKLRASRLYKHTLGTPASSDILLYEEQDDRFFVDVTKTKDMKYITLNINSKTTSEIHIIEPSGNLRLIHKRSDGVECFLEHYKDEFLIITSAGGANNLKLMRVSDSDPREENRREFIAEDPESRLEDMDVFTDHLILYERKFGLPRIRVINMLDNSSHHIPLPEPVCTIYPGANLDYNTNVVRFAYSSPVTPEITYDYDLTSKKLIFLRALQLAGPVPFDASRIECKQVHVVGHDNTHIPLTIVHKLGLQNDNKNPVLLIGYGAYGHGVHPEFHLEWLSLIQRGWIIAQAHVRGGGELGKKWYNDGKQLNKKNSFHDYISCAEYLINENFTSPSLLAAMGSSAGGLIMGAVANMRPELFGAMIMKVPFVDVTTSMVDDTLPLTLHEYDEWGNPNDENVFKYIWEYDPYQNIKMKGEGPNGGYPPMLLIGSTMDSRVQYWHPLKYTAKMRHEFYERNGENTEMKSTLLLRTNSESGHFGVGGRFGHLKEKSFEFSFLFKALHLKCK